LGKKASPAPALFTAGAPLSVLSDISPSRGEVANRKTSSFRNCAAISGTHASGDFHGKACADWPWGKSVPELVGVTARHGSRICASLVRDDEVKGNGDAVRFHLQDDSGRRSRIEIGEDKDNGYLGCLDKVVVIGCLLLRAIEVRKRSVVAKFIIVLLVLQAKLDYIYQNFKKPKQYPMLKLMIVRQNSFITR